MFTKIYKSLRHSAYLMLGVVLIMSSCSETIDDVTVADLDRISTMGQENIIPGQYIVVLNESTINFRKSTDYESNQVGMRKVANDIAGRYNIAEENVDKVYGNLLSGFSVKLDEAQLTALENDPSVAYVEPDGYVYASSTTQSNATWGLDRIDQRALPLNGTYTYTANGSGVKAYIIDTGIKTGHQEFGGRALQGFDAFGGDSEDCNGHGTHVAGTVGGTVYGVAKNVTLVGVRVLDCNGSGSFSGVIAGMDWVAADASGPSVANMSLGGGASTSVDDAVSRMYNAGVPVIVAAGNGDRLGREQPACNYSPARAARAYTVGATTNTDSKTSWSNYGDCVDIFAPGASITAAWHTSNTAINTISGTSMASPHVAGVAALYLQSNPSASAQAVYNFLSDTSTKGIVTNSRTANNHLLYSLGTSSGDDGGSTDPDPEDPTDPVDGDGIQLSGTASKVQGRWRAELTWSGVSTSQVDIYRNGTKIATVNNSGSYIDQTNFRGGGSLTYQVCEAGSSSCSATITLQF
ncbi:S8 family peptidase [Belliella pelovolcani]|uniref:S8 family peptidase n=1 Tax=Belliella pelovolcani TaxID=529505 RepID=UPI00391A8905